MSSKCSTLWGSLFVLIFTLFLGTTTANALPPGGASTVNTPGTSSTVSPGTLKAGDTLNFTLTGFPVNEQVYIKVDNGNACPSDSAQGACVVHQQKSDSNGQVRGSFVLSKQLAKGSHTLRFLSTEIVKDKDGQQIGTKGFSNESPAFTISGVNEKSSGGSQINVDPKVINKNSENSSGAQNKNTGSDKENKSSGNSRNGDAANTESSQGQDNSNSNESENTADGGTLEDETVYVDADGNEITEEEYNALMKASENSQKPVEKKLGKTKATTSATATASASKNSEVNTANQENTSKESEFPWLGVVALAIALALAGFVFYSRRKNQHHK